MNKALCFLVSALLAGAAFGADTAPSSASASAKQPTARQLKMITCGKLAKGKKGDEHKAFMKECLSKKDDAKPAPAAPQEKK